MIDWLKRLVGLPIDPQKPPTGLTWLSREPTDALTNDTQRQWIKRLCTGFLAGDGMGLIDVASGFDDDVSELLENAPYWLDCHSHGVPTFRTLSWYRVDVPCDPGVVSSLLEPWADDLQRNADKRYFAAYIVPDLLSGLPEGSSEDRRRAVQSRVGAVYEGLNGARPFRVLAGLDLRESLRLREDPWIGRRLHLLR